MRRSLSFLTIAILFFLLPKQANVNASISNIQSPIPCPQGITLPTRFSVDCLTVTIPENHARPDGRQIELFVALVHSSSSNPLPDPVIFLPGGPGGAGSDVLFLADGAFASILATRDLIFFDQRGIGLSQPSLTCPQAAEPISLAYLRYASGELNPTGVQDAVVREMAVCRDLFLSQGVDLAQYTTDQSAKDVPVIASSVGYTQWNLFGISYGGRYALEVVRDNPAGLRALILDSALPPQVDVFADVPGGLPYSLQKLFNDCDADFLCRTFYPYLQDEYTALVASLDQNPIQVDADIEDTGKTITIPINGELLTTALMQVINFPELRKNLPGVIYDTRDGDTQLLKQIIAAVPLTFSPKANIGLVVSAICAEEVPNTAGHGQTVYSPAGLYMAACQGWIPIPADPVADLPVTSDIPTLILSGNLDLDYTPVTSANLITEDLPNSFLIHLPNTGHGVIFEGTCPGAVMQAFLDDPTQAPDTTCTQKLKMPSFVISKTVVRTPARAAAALLGMILVVGVVRGTRPSITSSSLVKSILSGGLTKSKDADPRLPQGAALPSRFTIAWRASAKIQGWSSILVPIILLALVLPLDDQARFVQTFPFLADNHFLDTFIPLAMGIQAALLFSPADEQPLEILLITKRPISWVVIERLLTMFVMQTGIALLVTTFVLTIGNETDPAWLVILRWLAPAVLFTGLGVFATLSMRRSLFGLALVVLVYFGLQTTGEYLLDKWPAAWPVFPFLSPSDFTTGDFLLNRSILILLSLLLTLRGLHTLRDPEALFGTKKSRRTSPSHIFTPSPFPLLPSSPLLGVLRYEFLLIWRGRLLPLIFAVMLGFLTVSLFVTRSRMGAELAAMATTLSPETARNEITSALSGTLMALGMVTVMLLPAFTAEALPKDRQYGVAELLETLPVSPQALLFGKLLSSWGWVIGWLGAMFTMSILGGRLLLGPLALSPFLEMFFLTALPLGLYMSGMGILLASRQPNRRRAAIVGITFLGYIILLALTTTGGIRDSLLADPLVFAMYNLKTPGVELYTRADLWGAIGSMGVQLVGVWGLFSIRKIYGKF